MSSQETAVIFTAKSIERILAEGGTSSWRLDRNHARRCEYAVCTRNAYADWVEGPEAHHAAFIVGKIKDVVPSEDHEGRWMLLFSEYALVGDPGVGVPGIWKGDRNPVKYTPTANVGIDFSTLNWKPMPERQEAKDKAEAAPEEVQSKASDGMPKGLTMIEAKRGLAATFGVTPEAIEITIRG